MAAPRFQPVALGLLYHVSMEDKYKSLFTFTDCLNKMYDMLVRVQASAACSRLSACVRTGAAAGPHEMSSIGVGPHPHSDAAYFVRFDGTFAAWHSVLHCGKGSERRKVAGLHWFTPGAPPARAGAATPLCLDAPRRRPSFASQDLRNTPELIALAVNLTQNPRNAEVGSQQHPHRQRQSMGRCKKECRHGS